MFFLKALPSQGMIDGYTKEIGSVDHTVILDALTMMRQSSILVRRLNEYFAQHNLSQLRFLVLIVIDREIDRESLTPAEISQRLDVSKPVLTRAIGSLLDDGLVRSVTDATDRRAKQVSLSDKGKTRIKSMLPGYFREIAGYMEEIRKGVNANG